MNNLTTRKIVFGMLMTLVLAFSVQGIADALTLTETSPVVQSKRAGFRFEMTFSVGLTGNRVQYHPDYSSRRINAGDHAANQYIDSQGYEVTYIEPTNRFYRNTGVTPTGTLAIDPRPTYSTNSDGTTADPAAAGTPNSTPRYLVDTSGNVFDADGKPVYVQTGDGTRDPASPWRYTRAKATPSAIVANESARHDYNDEAIGITITQPDTSPTGTLKLGNPSYIFGSLTDESGTPARGDDAAYSLKERVGTIGLPSTINLVYENASVGTHTIKIWDATPLTDFPLNAVPSANRPRQSIMFTLHVTPATITLESDADIEPDIQRVRVEDAVEPVSGHLTFTPATGNNRIRYEVARGSGTLYVGTLEDQHTTPSTTQSVHQSSDVYLNTNGTSNEVHIFFAGEDRSAPRATIVFEYRGQALPTTPTTPTPPTTPATPGARLVAAPSPVTGAPGSPQSITISAADANNNPVTGAPITLDPFSSFISAGGSYSSSSGNSPFALTLTLPTTTGSYSFSAGSLGYPSISITVTVGGTASPGTSPTLVAQQTSITGAPGSQRLVSVTAQDANGNAVEGVSVTFAIVGFATQTTTTDVLGSAGWNLTLPTTAGPYTLNITATGYESASVPVTVSTTATPPTTTTAVRLLRADGNNQTGEPGTRLAEPLVVTVVNSAGQAVPNQVVQFVATRGGGRVSPSSATTNSSGQAQTRLTLGRTAGTNTVQATLNGVSVTFTATAELAPAYLEVYGESNRRGVLNDELTDPLVVQVLDDNEDGVAGVRVTFQVTSRNARLTQRGTGYALRVDTDRNGMAEAPLTPTGAGPITVRATANGLDPVEFTITTGPPPASLTIVSGNNQTGTPGSALANALVVQVQDAEGGAVDGVMVTFEVTAGGGSLSAETVTTDAQGRAQTRLTLGSERAINSVRASVTGLDAVTFNTSIDAVIHVAAANRPVMYWIDGGALYRLAGARAVRIAARASDVAVDMASGKIYWIEGTSDRSGRIHSANVDGTGAAVVKELTSVPMGLALDSANGKLYLTNSWGKIQRMNVDGTAFETNLIVGLGNPMDIAVSSGKVYWTDASGSVRYANTAGTKVVRNIATGSGALGGIAADSNKVYWTEQTGNTTGRIRSANLDGTGIADLFSLTAVPAGIAVDGNNVYWANGWGKVQRRNIDGSKFQDIATGLMMPGAVAIGGANVATPTPTPTPTPQQPTTAKSKYDVNGDGTVDTTDVGIVVAAVLSGSQQASLDVNGDGKVDLTDVVAVSQNVDNSGTAGAPAALRTRLSAVQVDRIQEQIDLLLAMNDRSPGALYTLQYLQNLLASARPEKTQLFANYPNPFNPETWIPYELATDTNVKVTIYDTQGTVVRTLSLGHQTAGYYTGRDRAAYWDGRNSFGEQVASGLYFYQLETDETSSMRKMVILK